MQGTGKKGRNSGKERSEMERSRERERKEKWRLKEKKEWLGGRGRIGAPTRQWIQQLAGDANSAL